MRRGPWETRLINRAPAKADLTVPNATRLVATLDAGAPASPAASEPHVLEAAVTGGRFIRGPVLSGSTAPGRGSRGSGSGSGLVDSPVDEDHERGPRSVSAGPGGRD